MARLFLVLTSSVVLSVSLGVAPSAWSAEDPTAAKVWFENALGLDVGVGGAPDARLAFVAMRRAAQAGDAQAAFNVAIMLDSGRGTARNVSEAAVWYARAAARGERRGSFNLGMLYESGEGVGANVDLARAWYMASNLPAARERIMDLRTPSHRPARTEAPQLLFPATDSPIEIGQQQVELVWTSRLEPEPVRYYVELRGFDGHILSELWSGFVDVSSLRLPIPAGMASFAWRVSAVSRGAAVYATSEWSIFTVPQALVSLKTAVSPLSTPAGQDISPNQSDSGQRARAAMTAPSASSPEAIRDPSPAAPKEVSAARAAAVILNDLTHSEVTEVAKSREPQESEVAEIVPQTRDAIQESEHPAVSTSAPPASGAQHGAPSVLIILAQPSIGKISDLNDRAVVIAGMNSLSLAVVSSALSAAGAGVVRLTEGVKTDVDRLLNGDVSAAVIANLSPEKAQSFPEISGLKLFRVNVAPDPPQ